MEKQDKKLIWIFAGEASGDIYGAKLAREMRNILPENKLRIAGMGSDNMRRAGVDIMVDSTELGVVGFIEILAHIGTFIKLFFNLKKRAIKERPDAVVLIDYPGFNIRFAREMYKNNIPVIWYISPHVWAWAGWRIPKLAKFCSKMMVIFPFEVEIYEKAGLSTEFVGHPLVDIIEERTDPTIIRDLKKVLLLPGSRYNEINLLFIPMLETAIELKKKHPDLTFALSSTRKGITDRIRELMDDYCRKNSISHDDLPEIDIRTGETDRLLQEAGTGIAASGTITVESAIAGLPLVVVYKVNPLSYIIGKILVDLEHFTMVNIIARRELFSEYLQKDVNGKNLAEAMERILPGANGREDTERGIEDTVNSLKTSSENASRKAAECVLKCISD